jgi:hypothetical protein
MICNRWRASRQASAEFRVRYQHCNEGNDFCKLIYKNHTQETPPKPNRIVKIERCGYHKSYLITFNKAESPNELKENVRKRCRRMTRVANFATIHNKTTALNILCSTDARS